jgi:hypothetical protein
VPVPHVGSLVELNELVARGDATDDRRRINGRRVTVGEHFAAEALTLQPLPAEAFDTTLLCTSRVDSKSRVCVRQNFYSVPARYSGRRIDVRLGAETVDAFDGARLVASHDRLTGRAGESLVLDHYLEVFRIKPGALPGATALARARASGAFSADHDEYWAAARRRLGDQAGTRAVTEILLAHRQLPAEAIRAGIRAALAVAVVDPAVVIVEARRAVGDRDTVVVPIGVLTRYDRPTPTITHYDELLNEAR